jgi:hypothetical protein
MSSSSADKITSRSILVAPDPISRPDALSGGTLLYFDAPIVLTIPPQVITPESFEILKHVEADRPDWAARLYGILSAWKGKREGTKAVLELLNPLHDDAFITAWLTYNADDDALARAGEFISSAGWTTDKYLSSVDTDNACGELVRHIFLEKFIELDRNVVELYKYSRYIFTSDNLPSLLANAYALRMLGLVSQGQAKIPIAQTNPRLVDFLADLPGPEVDDDADGMFLDKDAISMMIFNGLLSSWIDPLSKKSVEVLCALRKLKRAEIDRLKGKCLAVTEEVDRSSDAESLFNEVDQKVRFTIMPEVRDLLDLGDSAFRDYKEKLFGDRVFWTGFIGTVVGSLSETKLISAGAAISTLASMGAKAFSHYREIRQTVKKSDYSLIYTVANMTKR